MSESESLKQCPVCKKLIDLSEMYCNCGYEFGGNRCTNPECRRVCEDFNCLCPDCDSVTQNYYDGFLQGIPTNIK